ncbi:hypothetical protein [Amycolatopsis samaneae]|uniref:Uncharacterized protein n=1 Tax=Amycolatopsis samaneae TaxID=664691 RepID=A0ABW5GU30_9PSEU
MTQSVEVPLQEFVLDWTLPAPDGSRISFVASGQVTLLNGKRAYKIDGVLYIAEGGDRLRDIGNPKLFVRRNGVESSGRYWGWETITRQSGTRLADMDAYFIRTGYWAPADRSILLSLGAETGWTKKKTYSPTVRVRLVD